MAALPLLRVRRAARQTGLELAEVHAEEGAGVRTKVRTRAQTAASRDSRPGTPTCAAAHRAAGRASRSWTPSPPPRRPPRPIRGRRAAPTTQPPPPPPPPTPARRQSAEGPAPISAPKKGRRRWRGENVEVRGSRFEFRGKRAAMLTSSF